MSEYLRQRSRWRSGSVALLSGLWRGLRLAVSLRAVPVWIALAWLGAAFVAETWLSSGLDQVTFTTPDEAVNRLAARQISEYGSPALELQQQDPEDLLHPRHWVTLGRRAIPAYAPVSVYVYGLLTWLGTPGLFLLAALPASAAAAFAYGVALLLPPRRRWLSLFAPGLGFPALYWLLRPWMNISALLVSLCWAFLFWASWRTTGKKLWLTLSILCVGAGAAVRPDYAAYLFSVALLFTLAASFEDWKWIVALTLLAGVLAVVPNLVLNNLTTGDALRAAYQVLEERAGTTAVASPGTASKLLQLLGQLLLPMGLPTLREGLDFFRRYWLEIGPKDVLGFAPLPLLLFGQLAIVAHLRGKPRRVVLLYLGGLLILAVFSISRMETELFGADEKLGEIHHSIPRYWTPVYLFAALPPLLFLGRSQRWFIWVPGTLLAALLFVQGVRAIHSTETSSYTDLRRSTRWTRSLLPRLGKIPGDALVYTTMWDKVLWSRWQLATVGDPKPTAESMSRAVRSGRSVFTVTPNKGHIVSALEDELKQRGLVLKPVRTRSRVAVFSLDRLADSRKK